MHCAAPATLQALFAFLLVMMLGIDCLFLDEKSFDYDPDYKVRRVAYRRACAEQHCGSVSPLLCSCGRPLPATHTRLVRLGGVARVLIRAELGEES